LTFGQLVSQIMQIPLISATYSIFCQIVLPGM